MKVSWKILTVYVILNTTEILIFFRLLHRKKNIVFNQGILLYTVVSVSQLDIHIFGSPFVELTHALIYQLMQKYKREWQQWGGLYLVAWVVVVGSGSYLVIWVVEIGSLPSLVKLSIKLLMSSKPTEGRRWHRVTTEGIRCLGDCGGVHGARERRVIVVVVTGRDPVLMNLCQCRLTRQ